MNKQSFSTNKSFKFFLIIIIITAFFIRFALIDKFPPGLYSDETALGYNSYSLLKSGRDEFGKSWPLSFESFGDYKPPMSAWLMIPSIAVFGLNELSVRLPSVIAGTLTVLIVFFLSKEIFNKKMLPFIAAILIAISPWSILFSRSSMLVGTEVMFTSGALLFFLISIRRPIFLFLSSLCFAGAIYTYYGARITVVLLILTLALIFKKELVKVKLYVIGSLALGLILLSPLIFGIAKDPLILTGRAKTISIFYDPGIKLKLWEAHTLDGQQFPVYLSRFFHNKPYFYARDIVRRYLQHFSIDFLFLTGDPHPPFKIPNFGLIFVLDLPFFLYGLYLAIRNRNKKIMALTSYFFISPIAASLTFITPSANRSFNMIIGWTILAAFGIFSSINYFRSRYNILPKISVGFLTLGYLLLFGTFLYRYFISIPNTSPQIWHYGRKELVSKILMVENNYSQVVMSNKEGPAYIWLLFYKQYDPQKYWSSANVDHTPDNLGWIHVNSFDKYTFLEDLDWKNIEKKSGRLYVGYEEKIPENWNGVIDGKMYKLVIDDRVLYPSGKTAFKIAHLSEK